MSHFAPVSHPVYYAAHRFRLISGLGGRVRRLGTLTEFVTNSGEVLCRKVEDPGAEPSCWLRADLAEAASEFLVREDLEHRRIAAEVVAWSRDRDQQRADEQGVSLEQFRQKRNHDLARIDRRRGLQNAGMS